METEFAIVIKVSPTHSYSTTGTFGKKIETERDLAELLMCINKTIIDDFFNLKPGQPDNTPREIVKKVIVGYNDAMGITISTNVIISPPERIGMLEMAIRQQQDAFSPKSPKDRKNGVMGALETAERNLGRGLEEL